MDVALQLFINGVIAGTLLAIPAIGLTAIFAVLRFVNFALASLSTLGAYAGFVVNVSLGLPIWPALAAAFLAAAVVGVLIDDLVLRGMRPFGPLPTAIASVALLMLIENLVRFSFGNDLRSYDLPIERDWVFGDLRLGPAQFRNFLFAVAVAAAVFVLLATTRIGKAVRAVADNPLLAQVNGIDPRFVALLVTFFGAGLVGTGGMLLGLDTSIDPLTGYRALLPMFAAAILGGLGSIPGAVVGALLVGIGEELSTLVIPASYKTAVGFALIALVLLVRPAGLFGQGSIRL